MPGLTIKRFNRPDETRPFADKGQIELLNFEDVVVGRATFQPGWRWSSHVKPLVGTRSCQVHHTAFVLSGRMKIVMDDGEEAEVGPGQAVEIAPGHDGWVVGEEPCVMLDFTGAEEYAQRRAGQVSGAQPPAPH